MDHLLDRRETAGRGGNEHKGIFLKPKQLHFLGSEEGLRRGTACRASVRGEGRCSPTAARLPCGPTPQPCRDAGLSSLRRPVWASIPAVTSSGPARTLTRPQASRPGPAEARGLGRIGEAPPRPRRGGPHPHRAPLSHCRPASSALSAAPVAADSRGPACSPAPRVEAQPAVGSAGLGDRGPLALPGSPCGWTGTRSLTPRQQPPLS